MTYRAIRANKHPVQGALNLLALFADTNFKGVLQVKKPPYWKMTTTSTYSFHILSTLLGYTDKC